jgi:hypothetical protein
MLCPAFAPSHVAQVFRPEGFQLSIVILTAPAVSVSRLSGVPPSFCEGSGFVVPERRNRGVSPAFLPSGPLSPFAKPCSSGLQT